MVRKAHSTTIQIHLYNCLVICEFIFIYHTDKPKVYIVRAHGSRKVPSIPDYSTISRRVNKLDIEINEHVGNNIVIALDSTGIKVANRGEWI